MRRDTHTFLLAQAAVILRADGREAVADFLATPTPQPRRTIAG